VLTWHFHGSPTAGDLATEVGVLEAPREDTGRLTVDDSNLLGGDSSAGSGHPNPGKVVLAINGVIAAVGGTYVSSRGFWCQSIACDRKVRSTC
jgi:hypothetical protein